MMVTHDQEEALTMADRVVVMRAGAIEQVSTPSDIYDTPINRFVADFIGTMNILPGTLVRPGHVRLGQLEVEHAAVLQGLPGDIVSLCVRPEDVVVVEGRLGGMPNRMDARVAGLDFVGNVFRARLAPDCLDGMILTADLPTQLVRRYSIGVGQALPIGLPRDRLRVYPTVS
jgi:iron(III) transport system ATP-binding protein